MLGAMVGDALGLTREGLSPKYAPKIFGKEIYPNFITLPFCKNIIVCSDDTEHLWLTADALLHASNHQNSLDVFEKRLSGNLKNWSLSLPIGAGKATLQACLKLLIGVSPKKSGVFSAGNGATMRAPIIAAFFSHNPQLMESFLRTSTLMTHTDPKAYEGSWVIAKAVIMQMTQKFERPPISQFFDEIFYTSQDCRMIHDEDLFSSLKLAQEYLQKECSFHEYLKALGLDKKGISGYVNHTVPAVIYAWLFYYDDYQAGIENIILAGGDTDSTASLLGSLLGISCITNNREDMGSYTKWLNSIMDYPINVKKIELLAESVELKKLDGCPKFNFLAFVIRNICVLSIVLLHGFRRLIPFKFGK